MTFCKVSPSSRRRADTRKVSFQKLFTMVNLRWLDATIWTHLEKHEEEIGDFLRLFKYLTNILSFQKEVYHVEHVGYCSDKSILNLNLRACALRILSIWVEPNTKELTSVTFSVSKSGGSLKKCNTFVGENIPVTKSKTNHKTRRECKERLGKNKAKE